MAQIESPISAHPLLANEIPPSVHPVRPARRYAARRVDDDSVVRQLPIGWLEYAETTEVPRNCQLNYGEFCLPRESAAIKERQEKKKGGNLIPYPTVNPTVNRAPVLDLFFFLPLSSVVSLIPLGLTRHRERHSPSRHVAVSLTKKRGRRERERQANSLLVPLDGSGDSLPHRDDSRLPANWKWTLYVNDCRAQLLLEHTGLRKRIMEVASEL